MPTDGRRPSSVKTRAEDLWRRIPGYRIGAALAPLVDLHVDMIRASMRDDAPGESTYCLTVKPSPGRYDSDRDSYAYGIRSDREALVAAGDRESVWNAQLLDIFVDAAKAITHQEHELRARLAQQGIVSFDYWLLGEVARRLNYEGAAPEGARTRSRVRMESDLEGSPGRG